MSTINEAQLRQMVANQINEWLGATRGSTIHKKIINTYNTFPPVANDPNAYKMTVNDAWCACTVAAVDIILGITDYTDYDISCNSWINKAKKRGIWEENEAIKPSVGDYTLYDWSDPADTYATTDDKNAVNHIGIVTSVDGNTFYVTEGNMTSASKVGVRMVKVNGRYIRGFIRPNYKTIADAINSGKIPYPQIRPDGGYNNGTLTNDQVKEMQRYYKLTPDGYWGPGSRSTTGMTADEAWETYQAAINNNGTTVTYPSYTQGNTNEETIYNFLTQVMKFNTATCCGILANIKAESSFRTDALGDFGTSYGICQWHASRYTDLKNYCAKIGKRYKTLDGQLWFLRHELETTFSNMLPLLRSTENTANGASDAAIYWCKKFEQPNNADKVSIERGNTAKTIFWPKYSGTSVPGTHIGKLSSQNPYPAPMSTLKLGSKGDNVRWLQWMLWNLRFGTAGQTLEKFVDGSFGPGTQTSLKSFQATYGLDPDGSCGPKTRAKLKSL